MCIELPVKDRPVSRKRLRERQTLEFRCENAYQYDNLLGPVVRIALSTG